MAGLKKILSVVFLLAAFSTVRAASDDPQLKIVRTDVDSVRNGFITACHKFGIDVIAENTMNCNGVSFDLVYNQSDYIKFSGYRVRDLKTVYVNHNELTNNYARVAVGAASGDKAWEDAVDEPVAVHLEFVVVSTAPDYAVSQLFAEFEFQQPGAVVIRDTGAVTINLPVKKINYKIHSYVDVYPGDADNNGIVDTRDYLPIDRHNGTGALTKNFRSFKRENAGTMWYPQRVLRWDSAAVTYSDCDGNGDITIADGLITSANMDKTHESAMRALSNEPIKGLYSAENIAEDGDIRVPIAVSSRREFIALSGRAEIPQGFEIKGVEAGDFFDDSPTIICKPSGDGRSADFLISRSDRKSKASEGIAGYLVLTGSPSTLPDITTKNLTAITDYGMLFGIEPLKTSSVEPDAADVVILTGEVLEIGQPVGFADLAVYDYSGQNVMNRRIAGSANISLSELKRGVYFVVLKKKNEIIRKKILLTK